VKEPAGDATTMLVRMRAGDSRAADELLPLVYDELHRLASHYLRGERAGHTLQTTALVHEAYLRLVNQERVQTGDRVYFIALAARAMRRILVDHARQRLTGKRGGGQPRIPLDDAVALFESRSADLITLDDALHDLAQINRRQGSVVELRFFGGLTAEEAAEALGVTTRTVERDWRHARAWLYRALADGATDS
jgi:RNA polymerase sigma-70 factor (ECF subfamily)